MWLFKNNPYVVAVGHVSVCTAVESTDTSIPSVCVSDGNDICSCLNILLILFT